MEKGKCCWLWCSWDGDASCQSRTQVGHAGLQWDDTGQDGQVKSLLWGHHITWCQQLGDAMKHLEWYNGMSGVWERGRGFKVGRLGGFGGLCWKLCLQQEPCISPGSALPAPSPASPQPCSPLSQGAKYNPALGADIAPHRSQGPSHTTAPRDPLLGGMEVPFSFQHPEVPTACSGSMGVLGESHGGSSGSPKHPHAK